jgi:hypothetical protein
LLSLSILGGEHLHPNKKDALVPSGCMLLSPFKENIESVVVSMIVLDLHYMESAVTMSKPTFQLQPSAAQY